LEVALRPKPPEGKVFGAGLRKHLTRPAAEMLATRLLTDPLARTLVLCRDSDPAARNAALYEIAELLHLAGGIPWVSAASDPPTASALNHFTFVLSARGIRSDNSWMLLDSAAERPMLPRAAGREKVYAAIEQGYAAGAAYSAR
jgi:hypothetical protein